MIVIENKELLNSLWNKIYVDFSFKPTIDQNVVPFVLPIEHRVFKLTSQWSESQEKIINETLKGIGNSNIYALDWNHDCFEYNPNENIDFGFQFYDRNRDCNVYFPTYYPDGDYHFFISKDWSYGILGHPWREEIYCWGKELINKLEVLKDNLDMK